MHSESKRVFLFLGVGAVSTLFNYLVFWVCLSFFHVFYLFSNGIGYLAGVGLGFFLNARYTFEAGPRISIGRAFVYGMVYLLSLALSSGTLYGIVAGLNVPPQMANVLAIAQSTLTNYLGCKYIVFRKGRQQDVP